MSQANASERAERRREAFSRAGLPPTLPLAPEAPLEMSEPCLREALLRACSLSSLWESESQRVADALLDIAIIERIAQTGFSLELLDSYGATPLLRACRNGLFDHALALLRLGADPNPPVSSADLTPLFQALDQGHVQMTIALLEAGADRGLAMERLLSPAPARALPALEALRCWQERQAIAAAALPASRPPTHSRL